MLDVHALHRADPLREVEHLGLGERLGRVPATIALPDHRRVEALLDRRPDREGGRELVAVDLEIRAVADPDRVDLGEELVAGVAGEDVGEARLDPDPDEREPAGLFPPLRLRRTGRRRASRPSRRSRASSPCRGRCSPASKAAWKIGGLKRGSTALRIASHAFGAGELGDGRRVGGVDGCGAQALVAGAARSPGERDPRRRPRTPCARRSRGGARPRRPRLPLHPHPTTRTRMHARRYVSRVPPVGGMRPEDVYELTGVSDPRLRPGGNDVAYVVWSIDKDENEYRQSIWIAKTDGSEPPRRFTTGKNDAQPRWSPDGERLAFVSKRGDEEGAPPAVRDARRRRRAAMPDRSERRRRRAGVVAGRNADRLLRARPGRGLRGRRRQETGAAAVQAAPVQARQRRLDG